MTAATKLQDHGEIIKAALTDPAQVLRALGLWDGAIRIRGGYQIRCLWHSDRTPSCSVTVGEFGTLRALCFGGCGAHDVLHMIATVHRLGLSGADFQQVLQIGAQMAGLNLPGLSPTSVLPEARWQAPLPAPRTFPPASEVAALWAAAEPIETDPDLCPEADTAAADYLTGRAIDTGAVDLYQLARVLPTDAPAPPWARCRGVSWSRSHRLILPVVDYLGAVRSLRAWRIDGADSDAPKRTAAAGYTSAGLVLACPVARRMLATGQAPSWATEAAPLNVIVTEGEPDFLTMASRVSDANDAPPAILGIVAGSWCEAIADRIPDGSRVIIQTHDDRAGLGYGAAIYDSLADRYAAGRLTIHVSAALASKLQETAAP